jgi:hypothetical protein
LAAIVYFVLTGDAPFGGGDGRAILAQQLAGKIDLSRFHPELAAWLKRGLAADPDQRFTDAREMQSEWRHVWRHVVRDEAREPFGARVSRALEKLFDRVNRPV